MGSLETPGNNKQTKVTSRSPSPSSRLPSFSKPWNAASVCVEENTMSRCKSPVNIRHERGSSADTSLIRMDNVSSHGGSSDEPNIVEDERDTANRSFSGYLPNGGSSSEMLEESDISKTKAAIEHLLLKIARTKELIRREQTARDENVNEYLKLSSNANKQQLQRIKAMFEKKNQKYAQTISHHQKKLDSYNRKLQDLEAHGVSAHHRQPREVLRDMGQGLKSVGGNIRDGITGISGSVMSKPREFAHLIRNKFGSADNINSLSRIDDADATDDDRIHHGSATLPGGCSLSSSGGVKCGPSEEGSECSSVTSESNSGAPQSHTHNSQAKSSSIHSTNVDNECLPVDPTLSNNTLESVVVELRSRREEIDRLRNKLENVKKLVTKDIDTLNHALQEEKFKSERLEEQINDLTELHQNEVENLKQTICDMEEKVQYQSEERLRDIQEMLESCQTKISKMEHQQAQHQQYLTLEGLDNSSARALVVKLINIVLTILQVVLLLVATTAGILMPFLRTRFRIITTTILVISVIVMMKKWPDLRTDHFFEFLPVK